ncbi:MAG: class I SAM-dependent methyltransferase [Nitrospirae bacterium]|jgi:demethylmenaquinone methyltransferase/2-methoxy-6-polyprenyl-1,4-benzoquinol methylase|nr:class I SAM-dependent methyltransferase [Nitrospirota bacterium]
METFPLPSVTEKETVVQNMFTSAARAYDINNTVLSFGLHHLWKKLTISLLEIREGHTVIDLCGGTADLSLLAAAKSGTTGHVLTMDLNFAMLRIGLDKVRSKQAPRQGQSPVVVVQSNAEFLSLKDSSVDRLVVGFGLRNVSHLDLALSEIFRVLKPGGRFACLEFSTPVNGVWRQLYRFYSFALLPSIGKVISGDRTGIYEYLPASIARFPDQESFCSMIRDAGFRDVTYRNLSGGIVAIHMGVR